jgi:hypothetical protein
VTLRALRKSSEFGAILWLILRDCDHELAGAKVGRGAGKNGRKPRLDNVKARGQLR